MKEVILSIAVFLLVLISGCTNKKSKDDRPNIVFIMSDDHAWQAISAYGHDIGRLAPTPNIDRLADEGMIFTSSFVTNSLCGPSRAAIITGKFGHLNGFRNNGDNFNGDQQTFPKLLHDAGYQTAVVGKWHLKSLPQGFDFWRILPGQGMYYNPDFVEGDDTVRYQGYVTDLITDFALDWLENGRNKSRPFLLMYQHKAPHREWLPDEKYLDLYHDIAFPEPATLFDDHSGMGTAARDAEMLISKHMSLTSDNKIDPELADSLGFKPFLNWYTNAYYGNLERMTPEQRTAWDNVYDKVITDFRNHTPSGDDLTHWKFQRYMQDYLACIRSVDDNVGRMLDYLDKNGLADNTIVVYTSDQGFYLGEHGWFDKRFMYEESFRTPLIIRYPKMIKPGLVSEKLVQNIDYAPTFLELAGISIPSDLQGRSLAPIFRGDTIPWRDALYYHYYEFPGIHMVKRHYGIRTDRYKLIHFYNDIDEWELYDLQKDPMELRNVIDDPVYNNVRENLLLRLDSIMVHYREKPYSEWDDRIGM
jgi:arylsulfatase A-like enzyme